MGYTLRVLSVKTSLDAERELAAIGLDPFSIPNIGPKMLHRVLLLERIDPEEGRLLKQVLLALGGDAAVGAHGAERVQTGIPVILMGTDKQLRMLCAELLQRTFGL